MARGKKAATETPVTGQVMHLDRIGISMIQVDIVGKSSLLQNRFGDDAKESIEHSQTGQSTKRTQKKPRNPVVETRMAMHTLERLDYTDDRAFRHPKIGVPASCFKHAMVEGSRQLNDKDLPMTVLNGAIIGACPTHGDLIEVQYEDIIYRTDRVRIGKGAKHSRTTSLAYRPEFTNWRIKGLRLEFNENRLSAQQIITLLRFAGSTMGIQAWRKELQGPFGTFDIDETTIKVVNLL